MWLLGEHKHFCFCWSLAFGLRCSCHKSYKIQTLAVVVCHLESKHLALYQNGLSGSRDAKHQAEYDNCKHKNSGLIVFCIFFSIFLPSVSSLKDATRTFCLCIYFSVLTLSSLPCLVSVTGFPYWCLMFSYDQSVQYKRL